MSTTPAHRPRTPRRRDVTRPRPTPAAIALGTLLVVHGLAHLVGARDAALADGGGVSYLFGLWWVQGAMLRAIGLLWSVTAIAFGLTAWMVWAQLGPRRLTVAAVAGWSLGLSLLALPAAGLGVVVNLLLLAGAAASLPPRLRDHRRQALGA